MTKSASFDSVVTLCVERVGITTVQDRGRPGWAHLGVPHSGAADRASYELANRLAGNEPQAAAFETSGGLVLHAVRDMVIVLTGPDCEAFVDDAPLDRCRATRVAAGQRVRITRMRAGVRAYLAVTGGIDCTMMLGSRAHDTLSGVASGIVALPLSDGTEVSLGTSHGEPHSLDVPIATVLDGHVRLSEGPHAELFPPQVLEQLTKLEWTVSPASNRIGVRLTSTNSSKKSLADALRINSLGELNSMALVRGAVQLTPSGELVVMLADHPTTGGYPVVGVVHRGDVDQLSQLPPGAHVNLSWGD